MKNHPTENDLTIEMTGPNASRKFPRTLEAQNQVLKSLLIAYYRGHIDQLDNQDPSLYPGEASEFAELYFAELLTETLESFYAGNLGTSLQLFDKILHRSINLP